MYINFVSHGKNPNIWYCLYLNDVIKYLIYVVVNLKIHNVCKLGFILIFSNMEEHSSKQNTVPMEYPHHPKSRYNLQGMNYWCCCCFVGLREMKDNILYILQITLSSTIKKFAGVYSILFQVNYLYHLTYRISYQLWLKQLRIILSFEMAYLTISKVKIIGDCFNPSL